MIKYHQQTTDYVVSAKAAKAGYEYGDGVHPPLDGHLVMARTVLNGLGCDDAAKVLSELTGLHDVTEPDAEPATDLQQRFNNLLFERFAKRSGAYRQATQVDPSKASRSPSTDQSRSNALRRASQTRGHGDGAYRGESLLSLSRRGDEEMGQGCRSLAAT